MTLHPGHTPGSSRWLYARLYSHPDRQTDILTIHLLDLLSTWEDDQPPDWWFLRYRDPEPHLRLRILLHDARGYGAAAQRLGAWADRVRRLGLLRNIVLDTYYPEVGRYGTGAAMHAAEAVFAADSAVAIEALSITASGTPHPYAVITASFTDLAAAFTGSLSSGLSWLTDHVNHRPAPALARGIHGQAMCLADPSGDWAALRAVPGGEALALTWGRRRSALAAYRAHHQPGGGSRTRSGTGFSAASAPRPHGRDQPGLRTDLPSARPRRCARVGGPQRKERAITVDQRHAHAAAAVAQVSTTSARASRAAGAVP